MADRWGVRVYEKQKSLRGKASVRVTKSTVRVAFDDDPENIYEIPLEKAPQIVKNGKWVVSLSHQGDKMYSIAPIEGAYALKVKEIAHTPNQPPSASPYTSHWKSDQGKDMETNYEGFTLLFEITEGPCAGMSIGKFLRYYFVAAQDGFVLFDKPRSPHTKTLSDTLDAVGAFDKGPMKFSENILPALQARIQGANYPLMGIIKDGNLDSLTRVQNYVEEPGDTEEELGKKLDALEADPIPAPELGKAKPERKSKTTKEKIDEISPE